jgi:hypothetical protein
VTVDHVFFGIHAGANPAATTISTPFVIARRVARILLRRLRPCAESSRIGGVVIFREVGIHRVLSRDRQKSPFQFWAIVE